MTVIVEADVTSVRNLCLSDVLYLGRLVQPLQRFFDVRLLG